MTRAHTRRQVLSKLHPETEQFTVPLDHTHQPCPSKRGNPTHPLTTRHATRINISLYTLASATDPAPLPSLRTYQDNPPCPAGTVAMTKTLLTLKNEIFNG